MKENDDDVLNNSDDTSKSISESSNEKTSMDNLNNLPCNESNLGDDQKVAFDCIMNDLNNVKWSLSLILGLPGTGKSFLVNEIARVASSNMYVLRTSVYGITASLIKGCTVNHLIGNSNKKVDHPINPLSYEELCEFSIKVKKDRVGLIIIDEVSTLTTRMFHLFDLRFRQLLEKDDIPFGGVKVVLCGDFMQNTAIGGDELHVNSLLVARYNRKMYVPTERNRSKEAYFPNGVMQRTAEVFNQAKVYFLKKQFRCKDSDPEHMDLIRRMHKGEGITLKDIKI